MFANMSTAPKQFGYLLAFPSLVQVCMPNQYIQVENKAEVWIPRPWTAPKLAPYVHVLMETH